MKIDLSARQSGKTTRMVKWARENPLRAIITFSEEEADRLRGLYPDLYLRIFSWAKYQDKARMLGQMRPKEVAIDNADIILQGMVRDDITRISLSRI